MKILSGILGAILLLSVASCGMPPGVDVDYLVNDTQVCIVVHTEIDAHGISIETKPDSTVWICYTSPALMAKKAK